MNEYDKAKLEKAIEALKAWLDMQSSDNTAKLYGAASDLFDAKFNPAEYDDVE